MNIQAVEQKVFSWGRLPPVVVESSQAQLSSDAGLLPIRQLDERLGLTAQFTAVLADRRDDTKVRHSFDALVRARVYGILADSEDQNDHDLLRSDPVFKLIAGRSPDGPDLASQPTHSRFENAISVPSLSRLRDVLIDQFIASFEVPPARLTFDIDPFDDPTHGAQQLTFFHGYYGQYQYLPRVITCAENDQVVMCCLLYGTAHPALGAEDDVEHLVNRLRQAWPPLQIHLRGDSGFGVPRMSEVCERLGIDYSFGLGMNATLKAHSDDLLQQAMAAFETTGQPQRLFHAEWYQAGSWPHPRWTIIKVEAHAQGTNRRAVITSRPGARVIPAAAYDEYADRGESDRRRRMERGCAARNNELKCGLCADRLSDHRYMANLFRLYLHTITHNLLARLRHLVAAPPESLPPGQQRRLADPQTPTEALAPPHRRAYFNFRREQDALGAAHPATWRTRLIKVAAEVLVSARRILVRLSGSWPHLHHYRAIADAVLSVPARPVPG
jgi:hypothetical protein